MANSGAIDALVAGLVLAAFLCSTPSRGRGASAVLARMTKFAPLALVPLLASSVEHRGRTVAAVILTGGVLVLRPGLELFWERTLGFQSERSSPFSVWGLYGGLDALQPS